MKLFKMFGRGKGDEEVEDQLEALGDIEEEDYLDEIEEESEKESEEQPSEEKEKEKEDAVGLTEGKEKTGAGATSAGGASTGGAAAVQTVEAGPPEKTDDVMNLFQEEEVEERLPEFVMNRLSEIKGSQLLQECVEVKRQLVRP